MGSLSSLGRLAVCGVLATTVAVVTQYQSTAPAADHRDGPIFANTPMNGRADIGDIFLFKSPTNANNVVMCLTVSPFPGAMGGTPTTFDQTVIFDFKIDNNGDAIEDITFRMTFGAPDANGVQAVTLRGLPSTRFPPTGILASGRTGQNIPITGGGMFRAGIQDDPFIFDAVAFGMLASGTSTAPFPRNPAFNFFGPDVNTLAFVIEIPFSRIRGGTSTSFNLWARTERSGIQVDRTGRPAINTAIVPPFPRNNMTRGERRNAFNAGQPRNDRRDFRKDFLATLTAPPYSRPMDGPFPMSATSLADFLLPDVTSYDTAMPDGFPNGRRLRDDVIDVELGLLTGGAVTTDGVNDDNGDRITDGTMRPDGSVRPATFPYMGPPNLPVNAATAGFPRP